MSEDTKKDYTSTLNLPKTDFEMRGNLPQKEPKILEKWENEKIYFKALEKNKGNKSFILHDGPPYANGDIHIGHALNKITKDIVVKQKTMQGYYAPYIPGWDTHGLPIEKKAIESYGMKVEDVGVVEFRNKCKEFALLYVNKQRESFKRLGINADWENPYITLQPEYESKQIEVFGEMAKKGYIYRGLKPVYWCADCETALAEAEIEYKDDPNTSIYVKFEVANSNGKFNYDKKVYFVIWTTTTWTLPGNTGIAVNSEFDYVFIDTGEEILVMADCLVEETMKIAKIENYSVINTFKGKDLDGIICNHPFLDKKSKVVMGSFDTVDVSDSTGTGCVHIAPGHGHEDHLLGLKRGLDIVVPVDAKGYLTEDAGIFANIFYENANKIIREHLEKTNHLFATKILEHSYPHCWRCKQPVIYRATKQWFASVDGFRKQSLEEIKNVKWFPGWGQDRMTKMIEDRIDWCISRQRVWGVPIPIFYCKDCSKEMINEQTIDRIKNLFAEKGSNVWFEMSAEELLAPINPKCNKCGCTQFEKETDIMDVWFDSGSSHAGVLENRDELSTPADMYLEGNDQYRGWFQSSLLTSVAIKGKAPYKTVLIQGMVVDGEGKKMSKSLGNGVEPQEVINEFGADILRLWVSASDYTGDVRVSKEILKQLSEVYRKIRNTSKFILGNLNGFNPNENYVKYDSLQEVDKWALTRLSKLLEQVNISYENYEYHQVYYHINKFCVTDMSNLYLDIIKDRLYISRAESIERRAAQTVMFEILNVLTRVLAPIITFTAEEIWQYIPKLNTDNPSNIILNSWPSIKEEWVNEELANKWEQLIQVKEDVAKYLEQARADKLIGNSLGSKVKIFAQNKEYEFLNTNKHLLLEILIVSQLEILQGEKSIVIEKAEGEKCERCWMYSTTVGENQEHSSICKRCSELV